LPFQHFLVGGSGDFNFISISAFLFRERAKTWRLVLTNNPGCFISNYTHTDGLCSANLVTDIRSDWESSQQHYDILLTLSFGQTRAKPQTRSAFPNFQTA